MYKTGKKENKDMNDNSFKQKMKLKELNKGITLIALVITIVLNSSYLAMDQMNKIEKI